MGKGGEGRGGSIPTLCVLWSSVSLFTGIWRQGEGSFQISILDSEAGVGPISLRYCYTHVYMHSLRVFLVNFVNILASVNELKWSVKVLRCVCVCSCMHDILK